MCYNILAIWEVQEQLVKGKLHKTLNVTKEGLVHEFDVIYLIHKEDKAVALNLAIKLIYELDWGIEIVEGIFQYTNKDGCIQQTTSMHEFEEAKMVNKKPHWRYLGHPEPIALNNELPNFALVKLKWDNHVVSMRVQNDEICLRYSGVLRLVLQPDGKYQQGWQHDYYLTSLPKEDVFGKLYDENDNLLVDGIKINFFKMAVLKP